MKRHLTDGELRASLDAELEEGLLLHLDACPECQTRLLQLKQEHLRSANRLSFLNQGDRTCSIGSVCVEPFYPGIFKSKGDIHV
ncbi:hypothetical protein [Candidatus Villigracilis affinis]|uniref:hypothetical protein n=1 Tax=Candidatus Villigracilis affinis TaxID=3140682 RepID=UPI001E0FF723|nr:hypothetical protein [Anaerolineales bacterium]